MGGGGGGGGQQPFSRRPNLVSAVCYVVGCVCVCVCVCAFILFGRADGIILPGRRCKRTAELAVIPPVCRAESVSVTTTVQKHAHSPTVSVGQKQNKKKKEVGGGGGGGGDGCRLLRFRLRRIAGHPIQ